MQYRIRRRGQSRHRGRRPAVRVPPQPGSAAGAEHAGRPATSRCDSGPATLAAVGPRLLRATDDDLRPTDVIDTTGIVMTRDGRHFDRGAGETDRGQYGRTEEVFGISGAAVLLRREALERSRVDRQIFDEDFFAFREDADLAWRLRGFGYSARYVPDARRLAPPERDTGASASAVRRSSIAIRSRTGSCSGSTTRMPAGCCTSERSVSPATSSSSAPA